MRRRTLVDLLRANLERDPGDAPAVYVEADVMADDMARYTPTALGPPWHLGPGLADVPTDELTQ